MSSPSIFLTCLLLLATVHGAPAGAQGAGSGKNIEDLLPMSSMEDDPIGIDEDHGALDRVDISARKRSSRPQDSDLFGPAPPTFRARKGEVLTAVPSVKEVLHSAEITLRDGLAEVALELRFIGSSDKPSELSYRLAVPPGAGLASLQVCNAAGCREGVADRSKGRFDAYDDAVQSRGPADAGPVGHAQELKDDRGEALLLRAAPVLKGDPLTLRVRYVADAPLRGGIVRFALPARGMDPRAAPTEVRLHSPDLIDPRIVGHPAQGPPALFDP